MCVKEDIFVQFNYFIELAATRSNMCDNAVAASYIATYPIPSAQLECLLGIANIISSLFFYLCIVFLLCCILKYTP